MLAGRHDEGPGQGLRLHADLLRRADVVVEQALPADVVSLLALGAGAFLAVNTDGHDGFLCLLAGDQKAALWWQGH